MITLGDFAKSNLEILVFVLFCFILPGCLFDYCKKKSYRRCKKTCGKDECREWLCKYYNAPRPQYVLVSQGVEIFRTYNKNEALLYRDESNDRWHKYVEECINECEPYADNEVFLYIEDGKGSVNLWI